MSSVCISSCVNDTALPSRVRATYVNLHRWPESDAEFVRSLSSRSTSSAGSEHQFHHRRYPSMTSSTGCGPKVVDSISCRQVYLRSYTFTRKKESVNERTIKCFRKVKDKVVINGRDTKNSKGSFLRASESMGRKVKEAPCAAFKCLFKKLLFCSASVDVVHVND